MHSSRPVDASLKFVETIAAYKRSPRSTTEGDVMQAFFECQRVRRAIAAACWKFSMSEHVEDITQTVALLFHSKLLGDLRDPEMVYNVIHRTATNLARRGIARIREASLDAILANTDGEPGLLLESAGEHENLPLTEAEHERALRSFEQLTGISSYPVKKPKVKRMPQAKGNSIPSLQTVQQSDQPQSPKLRTSLWMGPFSDVKEMVRLPRDTAPSQVQPDDPGVALDGGSPSQLRDVVNTAMLCPDGRELNDIRVEYNFTLSRFAEELGIKKSQLTTYLYGAGQPVPMDIMERARDIKAQGHSRRYNETVEKFSGMTMAEIVETWVDQYVKIGLTAEEASKTVNEVLQVDRTTVWRWRNRGMMTDWRRVVHYDTLIELDLQTRALKAKRAAMRRFSDSSPAPLLGPDDSP